MCNQFHFLVSIPKTQKYMDTIIHCNTQHKSLNMESTQVLSNRWVDSEGEPYKCDTMQLERI